MSKKVEQVAKEIHYTMCSLGFGSICSWPPSDRKRDAAVRKIARNSIEAMREPNADTEELLLWNSMIDEALK